MTSLVLAAALFLATHFVASTPLRPKLVAAMGEWPYRGVYSAVALITFGWMIWAYVHTTRQPLWPGLHVLPVIVVPIAFVLIACGYFRNPTMVGADALLKSEDPARGMIRITRHPIMWGLMLWAAAHVLALQLLLKGHSGGAFNLGTGNGFSVREILAAIAAETGREVPHVVKPRRAGDPTYLVADASAARDVLKFVPKHSDLPTIIRTAWAWHRKAHPLKTGEPANTDKSASPPRKFTAA